MEFSVDKNCTIVAKAAVEGLPLSAKQSFEIPVDLSTEQVAKILADAEGSRNSDEQELLRIEAINRARILIGQAERKLRNGPNTQLSEAVAAVGLALASGDTKQIREKSNLLEALTAVPSSFEDIFKDLFSKPSFPAQKKAAATKPAPPREQRVSSSATNAQKPRSPGQNQAGATTANEGSEQTLTSPTTIHQIGKLFGGANFTLDPQLCFVLMPFADDYRPLYEDQIRPSVVGAGLRCERADEIKGMSLITWDIWERINRARFLIADLTDQNPNVFYELGLAHAIGKDVILITQSKDFVPFDLQGIRWIKYDFTPRGTQKLEADLKATIAELMKSG